MAIYCRRRGTLNHLGVNDIFKTVKRKLIEIFKIKIM